MQLILASQSPRRAQLLGQIALPFDVQIENVDESLRPTEGAVDYVRRLAIDKAQAGLRRALKTHAMKTHGARRDAMVVLGADTIVLLEHEILGKPRSLNEGRSMLRRLSGKTHIVHTGVAVAGDDQTESSVVSTKVTFRELSERQIDAYLATGEGMDKAGSYGIQGIGGIFVERIEGSFTGVMGLPVAETEALLLSLNVDTWSMRDPWLKNSS